MGRYGGEIAVVGVKTRARAALTMAAKNSSSAPPSKKIKKGSKTPSYNTTSCNYQLRSSSRRRNLPTPENLAVRDSTAAEATVAMAVEVKVKEVANCSSSDVITTATTTVNSDFPPSCCSSNENKEDNEIDRSSFAKDVLLDRCGGDPEVENTCDFGEASSTRKEKKKEAASLRGEEEEEEATKSNGQDYNSPSTNIPEGKSTAQIKRMPSDSEIEEFFTAAEKDIQKHFIDKYNFDIVKDVPLEGRYEWVQIKP